MTLARCLAAAYFVIVLGAILTALMVQIPDPPIPPCWARAYPNGTSVTAGDCRLPEPGKPNVAHFSWSKE